MPLKIPMCVLDLTKLQCISFLSSCRIYCVFAYALWCTQACAFADFSSMLTNAMLET